VTTAAASVSQRTTPRCWPVSRVAQRGFHLRSAADPARQQLGESLGADGILLPEPALPLHVVGRLDSVTNVVDVGVEQLAQHCRLLREVHDRVAMPSQFVQADDEEPCVAQVVGAPERTEWHAALREPLRELQRPRRGLDEVQVDRLLHQVQKLRHVGLDAGPQPTDDHFVPAELTDLAQQRLQQFADDLGNPRRDRRRNLHQRRAFHRRLGHRHLQPGRAVRRRNSRIRERA
jgi:hypothetical protein